MNAAWPRRVARCCAWLGLLPLGAFLALHLSSWCVPFPEALRQAPEYGQRILDRDGRLLARTMARDGVFRAPLSLDELGPHLVPAMLAAEDKRFFTHSGVDYWAIARACLQALARGSLVSGASTITQQLARTTFERPRTLGGKWHEMALALRIEATLSKQQILEQYLSRVYFGPNIVGAAAAADHFFGKTLAALSLSEAATLTGLVRGPSLYDPRVRPELAQRRRDRVLTRMLASGLVEEDAVRGAQASRVLLLPRPPLVGAKHWVREAGARSGQELARTTLSGPLQRLVETVVAERALQLEEKGAHAASVLVLDNQSGDVLAWVGSPNFDDERGGQNDGVLARRQPGSTLKPLLYGMAIDELEMTTASQLPDVPTHVRTADSFYAPRNFDRIFRGQVSLRRALSNSLNVPAVHVLTKLGIAHALTRLRELGLESLSEEAEHYGPALALGDGEVTLLELTSAYAALARGGTTLTPRFRIDAPRASARRVLSPEASALITEVLSDDAARREAFGAYNALDLPFPVAVKTGTSKGYRDSWTIGYTRTVTVGVWVGNFDGRPTRRITGARGAGPLFHQVMKLAEEFSARGRSRAGQGARPLHDVPLVRASVCSGESQPRARDQARVGSDGGDCEPGTRSVLEWFTEAQLARADARHLASDGELGGQAAASPPRVEFPRDGMVFDYSAAIPAARQKLVLRASSDVQPLALLLDGRALPSEDGVTEWTLERGRHVLVAQAGGTSSQAVEFRVR